MDCQSLLGVDDPSEGSWDEVAERYQWARHFAQAFSDLANLMEADLAARMDEDVVTTRSGVFRRAEATRSTWSDDGASERMRDDLARAVARTVAIDIATGEIDELKRNVAMATMRTAYSAIPSFSNLKVAGRRHLGLQIGNYRSFETYYRVMVEDNL